MEDFILEIKFLLKNFDKEYEIEIGKWITINDVINALERKVAINWEMKIEAEHQRNYVTDDLENTFKDFTVQCMQIIIKFFDIISKNNKEPLQQLFSHRHFGYGFYKSYEKVLKDQIVIKETYAEILNNIEYCKILYMSLVKYFGKFYGRFYDNVEAIRMVCIYFANDVNFTEIDNEVIANSLYAHITTAGTPGDTGYAYEGISCITQYINRLPENIVLKILGKYKFYQIINDKTYRNQLYTIIKYMNSKIDKKEYKFFFIDSVLILNIFQRLILKNGKDEWEGFSWNEHSIMNSKIEILNNHKEKEEFDLIYDQFNSRKIRSSYKILLNILLIDGNIKIRYLKKEIQNDMNFDDWILNCYRDDGFYNKLQKKFFSDVTTNTNANISGLTFSYIYLNNYRGLKHQSLSFDKKYTYNYLDKEIQLNSHSSLSIPYFYGKNIYSLSCIVGKNGSGKTSIVDFLSNEFFKVLYLFDTSTVWIGKDSQEDIIQN